MPVAQKMLRISGHGSMVKIHRAEGKCKGLLPAAHMLILHVYAFTASCGIPSFGKLGLPWPVAINGNKL